MKVLSIKDRIKLLYRVLKLVLSKDTNYVNILWKNSGTKIPTHTFYAEGIDPKEPFLEYIATVAGNSKTIEDLNKRAEFFLDKSTVAYCLLNKLDLDKYAYVDNPIRKVGREWEFIY